MRVARGLVAAGLFRYNFRPDVLTSKDPSPLDETNPCDPNEGCSAVRRAPGRLWEDANRTDISGRCGAGHLVSSVAELDVGVGCSDVRRL